MASFEEFVKEINEREALAQAQDVIDYPHGYFTVTSWPDAEDGTSRDWTDPVVTRIAYGPKVHLPERQYTEPSPLGKYLLVVNHDRTFLCKIYWEPTFGTFNIAMEDAITGEEFDGKMLASQLASVDLFEDRYDLYEAYEQSLEEAEEPAVAPAPKPKFSPRDIKDPRSYQFPARQWIIPGWISEGLYTSIIAAPGQGKSTLSLAMCRAISEGTPFLGFAVAPRPVLYLDRENPWENIKTRFEWFKMKQDEPNMMYFASHVPEKEVYEANDQDLLKFVQDEPVKPVIIFDSLVRFLPSGNDSNQEEVTAFYKHIAQLRAAGAAIVVLHHSGKGDSTKEGRGSLDITAQCDIKLLMVATKQDGLKLRQVEVWQPRARLHVENGIPTGPDQRVQIDIAEDGTLTMSREEDSSKGDKAMTFLGKQEAQKLIELMTKNPDFKLADLKSWAWTMHQIPDKLTKKFFEEQRKSGAISEKKIDRNLKAYSWVEPDHFRAYKNVVSSPTNGV